MKLNATRGRPPDAHTSPGAPFTIAGCAAWARPEKVFATSAAPRPSADAPLLHGGAVGSGHDVGIEHREKSIEVAAWWACAGIAFDLTGAALSHIVMGHPAVMGRTNDFCPFENSDFNSESRR